MIMAFKFLNKQLLMISHFQVTIQPAIRSVFTALILSSFLRLEKSARMTQIVISDDAGFSQVMK